MGLVLFRDAGSVVFDGEGDLLSVAREADGDFAACGRELRGVVQEVLDDLPELRLVSAEGRHRADVEDEGLSLRLDGGLIEIGDGPHQVREVEGRARRAVESASRLRNLEHRVDEVEHPLRLGTDRPCEFLGGESVHERELGRGGEARQRRLEVVRDVVRQLPEVRERARIPPGDRQAPERAEKLQDDERERGQNEEDGFARVFGDVVVVDGEEDEEKRRREQGDDARVGEVSDQELPPEALFGRRVR